MYEDGGGFSIPTWEAFRERAAMAVRDYGALVIDSHDQRTPLRTIRAPSRPTIYFEFNNYNVR